VSLRLRISIAAALLLVVLSVVGVLLVSFVGHTELRQVDQQLEDTIPVARSINGVTVPISPGKSALRGDSANHLSAFYMAVITNGHRTVISTPLDVAKQSPKTPTVLSTSRQDVSIVTVGSRSGTLDWRAILVQPPNSSSDLLVAVSLSQVNATMSFLHDALLIAGAIMLSVVVAAGYWIARLGLRPIAEVTEVADAIAAGDRTRRVTKATHGTEAGKLAEAFNLMLDEQLALEERLRQFVADASHELRTPVSVILGISELWRDGKLRVGEESDEAIHRIGVASGQIGTLVEELLILARLDEGRPLHRSTIDLAQLVDDVVVEAGTTDPLRPIAVNVAGPVVVHGDIVGLRRAVNNLVTNALRHTPTGADIDIRVWADGEVVSLQVRDSGPGMTSDEQRHAFDRFWQADSSRSRSGAGLGLSIVRGIVTAHQGRVELESDPLTGTSFTVILPQKESTPVNLVTVESDETVE
jgi:two-component system OmpR family sensor kinase